jgi:hypothetical protein
MLNPSEEELAARADLYADARHIRRDCKLGGGKDGTVFQTSAATAIKVFHRPETFNRERECYVRLTEMSVRTILGHAVPQMLDSDEHLMVIEMTIVEPPFILDFASAYVDYPPDFSDEVIENWEFKKQYQFGPRLSDVLILLEMLKETYGIYFLDPSPGNIQFGEGGL